MKVNQTLNSAGSEPFVIWFLSGYCSVPLTLTIGSSCGSGGGNPVVPWRPTHIPSTPHGETWCPLGSPDSILTCDVTGAEAELDCVPAWWGALDGSVPRMGYPRKALALAVAAFCSWVSSPSFKGTWVTQIPVFCRQQSDLALGVRHNHPIYTVTSSFVHRVACGTSPSNPLEL